MFDVLASARIVINHYGDVPPFANNIRLYEVTGVGSMLLTDDMVNLRGIFEPGDEVTTYASPTDCARKILYFLEHDYDPRPNRSRRQARL
jgi:spore maturation protein CgeB